MRTISVRCAVFFLFAIACSPLPAFADVIYYKSGETLKGLVVEEHRDRLLVNVDGKERAILRRDIEEVFYDDPERNYLYLGNQALEAKNFALARGFFHKALQIRPDFQEAQDALHRVEDFQKKGAVYAIVPISEKTMESGWGLVLNLSVEDLQGGGTVARQSFFPVVKEVRYGSLADRHRILPGDGLVSLWGDSLAFLSLKEVFGVLLGPPGSEVKLTIQRKVVLEPAPKEGQRWPGLTLEMGRRGLTVAGVEPASAAQTVGLRSGDRIVAIGQRSTRYLPLEEARRILSDSKGKSIFLVIHRDLMIQRE